MFLLLSFPSCGQADASSLLRHPIYFILVLTLISQSSTMLSVLLNLICTGLFLVLRTLAQAGIYKKPFLLALQPPLVELGEKVTLECRSEIMFDTFVLTSHKNGTIKDSFKLSAEHYHGGSQANFSIGPVTPDDAGTYTCYGSFNHSPYEWSESGDPIDIKITGLYKKPSLSALMGPVVMSGENMTLSCISNHQFDMFNLSIEGVPLGQGLPAVQSHSGTFKPNFLLGPVIQTGNYRCYGSFSNSSHVWPSSSDPWYFPVTDKKASHRDLIFCD
nr:killer cell immunoglobulin-like receptor 3DL1 [Peromyscus maniculatus bairdii]